MAVEVYSKNLIGMHSQGFSFSNDPIQNERLNSRRLDHNVTDSAFDFAFNVDFRTGFQPSTADELFSNGKIRPTCVNNEGIRRVKQGELVVPCLDPQSKTITEHKKKSLKEFLEDSSEEEEPNTATAKPFWKFRRSNSLNCDRNQSNKLIGSSKNLLRSGSTGKFLEKIMEDEQEEKTHSNYNMSLFRIFTRSNSLTSVDVNTTVNVNASNKGVNQSLNMLRRSHSTSDHYVTNSNSNSMPFKRSNSTGSAPDHTRNKKNQLSLKHQQNDHQFINGYVKSTQKGKAKNNKAHSFGDYYNNNVKMSPALNLPSPYISRVSVDLFGFGSVFCSGSKDRKKKK